VGAVNNLRGTSLTCSQVLLLIQSQTLHIADWKKSMTSHTAEEAQPYLRSPESRSPRNPSCIKRDSMVSYLVFRLTWYCCHIILRTTRLCFKASLRYEVGPGNIVTSVFYPSNGIGSATNTSRLPQFFPELFIHHFPDLSSEWDYVLRGPSRPFP
jgi:hypothetical protein